MQIDAIHMICSVLFLLKLLLQRLHINEYELRYGENLLNIWQSLGSKFEYQIQGALMIRRIRWNAKVEEAQYEL
jgi:hypothetical protein